MLRQLRWKSLLAIIVIVGVAAAALAVPDYRIPGIGARGSQDILGLRLGLDLAGGTQLIYQAGVEGEVPTAEQMQGLVSTITRRIDRLGVAEPSIQQLGEDRLLIQLPGVEDTQQAKDLIGQTAQLEIVERICDNASCTAFEDRPSGLTGGDMARAFPSQDQTTNRPVLSFELNRDAAQQFAVMTQRIFSTNITDSPDQLAFVLDGEVLVSAVVNSPILAGVGIIQGTFTAEEVRQLAIQVESGRLPVDIEELSSSVVAGSLGAQSLDESKNAGGWGQHLEL
ncbi:MAG: hypothetical protein F4Y96_02965, partial [Chloroflexi bacterium]|nr:hypothetical protein [Chloroflexota bacterium]